MAAVEWSGSLGHVVMGAKTLEEDVDSLLMWKHSQVAAVAVVSRCSQLSELETTCSLLAVKWVAATLVGLWTEVELMESKMFVAVSDFAPGPKNS